MTHRVYFAADARADLDRIAAYIARDNPARAISFIDELQRRTVDFLSLFPRGGTRYRKATRYLVLSGYIVLYEIDDVQDAVYVLHIVHGRTDWKKA